MRWIMPARIRTAAPRAIKTAHESSEKRGADLICVGWLLLLILFLLRQEILELEKPGMESLSQLKSVGVVASVAEAATRPTSSRAGAGSGAICVRPATVVACCDWSGWEALEITRTGVSGETAASCSQRETSEYSGPGM